MRTGKSMWLAAALAAVSLSGHATLVGSTAGGVLTMTDSFNAAAGQCSYIGFVNGSCVSGTTQSPDGYMQMGSGIQATSATAGFSFSTYPFTTQNSNVTVSFWYSTGLKKDAVFTFAGIDHPLYGVGNNAINPGANTTASSEDEFFTITVPNLASGSYSLLWSAGTGTMRTLKIDDLSLTVTPIASQVTAVPEPETYAMLLAGMGLIGAVVRRRKNDVASGG